MGAGIESLLTLAHGVGLSSHDGAWSEAYVHWFDRPMPDSVRVAGNADPLLEHFAVARTPHTPAHEGFIDRDRKVAITFETDAR